MDQIASTVIQPTHTFRIQLSPTPRPKQAIRRQPAGTEKGHASPTSYTFQAFFDGEPLVKLKR